MAKFKHVLLAIAIAIVFVFFVGFGIATFYESPIYEDYCGDRYYEKPYPGSLEGFGDCKYIEPDETLKKECKEKGDIWPKYDQNGCVENYYCETCDWEFEEENEKYNRVVFIVATIIGLIALISGIALKVPSVSSGLMGGGILTILYGTMRYWFGLPDFARFILLGIALGILIWVGYKKLKK